jgi:hypothetical protein
MEGKVTSESQRIKSLLLRPTSILLVTSALIYVVYTAGENPKSPSYEGLRPFQLAAEEPSTGVPAVLTRQILILQQRTRTGQTQPFFDDPPAAGYLTASFSSSKPIRQTFRFAFDPRVKVTEFSLGQPSKEGRSMSEYSAISSAPPPDGAKSSGAWKDVSETDRFSIVAVPVERPAGQYMLSVAFEMNVKDVRYHQRWGENRIYLTLQQALFEFATEYRGRRFVDPASTGSPVDSEVRYYERNDDIALSAPVPDVELAELRAMRWVREDGDEISVQFIAVDSRVRFWMDRVIDLVILVLGAAIGTLFSPWPRSPVRDQADDAADVRPEDSDHDSVPDS